MNQWTKSEHKPGAIFQFILLNEGVEADNFDINIYPECTNFDELVNDGSEFKDELLDQINQSGGRVWEQTDLTIQFDVNHVMYLAIFEEGQIIWSPKYGVPALIETI